MNRKKSWNQKEVLESGYGKHATAIASAGATLAAPAQPPAAAAPATRGGGLRFPFPVRMPACVRTLKLLRVCAGTPTSFHLSAS
jgi:hypothetical protein